MMSAHTAEINKLNTRLTAINKYYYRTHPPMERLGQSTRLKSREIKETLSINWEAIKDTMNDSIAIMDYDSMLVFASKAIANLRLHEHPAQNMLPGFLRPALRMVNDVFSDSIEEKLLIVEGWINMLEQELMPSLPARARAAAGAAMDRVRGYFHRPN